MRPSPPVDEPASTRAVGAPSLRDRLGDPARGPLITGLVASLMMLVGSFGAGGVLVRDPILSNSPLGFWRYGHGNALAAFCVYAGVAVMGWAWVRLGRDVLAERASARAVLTTAFVWTLPLLFGPPLFTRDVFSYLAQGALPLAGFDPYAVGPEAMPGIFSDNVHFFWQDTPAPYGPLFILIAKGVAAVVGDNIIAGVILMRLALLPGLALLVWMLPKLTRRLGGRVPLAYWITVANPVMVIHLVGGGHNDLLVTGLLVAGSVLALQGVRAGGREIGPALGIAVVTLAMAVKASAAVALPFLVLIWAAQCSGSLRTRIVKAAAAGLSIFVVVFAVCTVLAGVGLGWLPALSAPSMIVNWMSIPTGVGEFVHFLASVFGYMPKQPFINVARAIGGIALAVIAVRQWWAARNGGTDAIRNAGVVLLAVAVLSPATLPWYLSWGTVLLAATAWTLRNLQIMVFVSLMLVVLYYANGEDALYNPAYLILCAAGAALAAVSLRQVDPLRLAAGARRRAPALPSIAPIEVAPMVDGPVADGPGLGATAVAGSAAGSEVPAVPATESAPQRAG